MKKGNPKMYRLRIFTQIHIFINMIKNIESR